MASKVWGFLPCVALFFALCHYDVSSYPAQTLTTAFFKIMPIVYLIMLCFQTQLHDMEHARYRSNIIIGLLLSMVGDIFLVWRHDLFIPGLFFFAIAHVFYIRAFRMQPVGGETAVVCYLAVIVIFMFFLPGLKDNIEKVMVLFYLSLIFTMWWRSIVKWQREVSVGTLCACFGAFTFLFSDFIIGMDKWRMDVPYGSSLIMLSYYLAQLMVTMSVYLYTPPGMDLYDRQKKRG